MAAAAPLDEPSGPYFDMSGDNDHDDAPADFSLLEEKKDPGDVGVKELIYVHRNKSLEATSPGQPVTLVPQKRTVFGVSIPFNLTTQQSDLLWYPKASVMASLQARGPTLGTPMIQASFDRGDSPILVGVECQNFNSMTMETVAVSVYYTKMDGPDGRKRKIRQDTRASNHFSASYSGSFPPALIVGPNLTASNSGARQRIGSMTYAAAKPNVAMDAKILGYIYNGGQAQANPDFYASGSTDDERMKVLARFKELMTTNVPSWKDPGENPTSKFTVQCTAKECSAMYLAVNKGMQNVDDDDDLTEQDFMLIDDTLCVQISLFRHNDSGTFDPTNLLNSTPSPSTALVPPTPAPSSSSAPRGDTAPAASGRTRATGAGSGTPLPSTVSRNLPDAPRNDTKGLVTLRFMIPFQ